MFVRQLIASDVPVLSASDSGDSAMLSMQEFHLSHLPIAQNEEYLGLVSEDMLLDWDRPEQPLSELVPHLSKPMVYAHQHPYEAIKRSVQLGLSLVPVLDEENKFMGSVTKSGLLDAVALQTGIDRSGGILTLEMRAADYSLSEIARICENNDVILLNVQIFTQSDSDTMDVVLKTNTTEVQSLVASFERYEYRVKEVFGEMPAYENMVERYRSLMNYINMGPRN